ncbi:beta-galactosidase [Pseudonocardia xinjiangensis]|uniref:Glycoside hydrolase family 42 N-terminal domain-containing protein n=1 Tax=Pseudonocardia xinjiangensis TaxID=75289 RepID=A0ABX1RI50_9PSEU|nr:beta-galactosidase [Pseudonocardia xinjiangensis]NMH80058.1 hypothetical protein [Pseudonocardia xinjiangensis]
MRGGRSRAGERGSVHQIRCAIARQQAQRYGDHPTLQAWHVHNEYGTTSWSEHAAAAFRGWMQRRYGSLKRLDTAWYTAFWSQNGGRQDDRQGGSQGALFFQWHAPAGGAETWHGGLVPHVARWMPRRSGVVGEVTGLGGGDDVARFRAR